MLIAITFIVAISCSLTIALVLQSQKNQKENLKVIGEINHKLNLIEQRLPLQFGELSKKLNETSVEHFQQMVDNQKNTNNEILIQMSQKLDERVKLISEQLKGDLHKYVNYDEIQQNEWLNLIQSQTNQRTKIQFIESAMNKFPSNRQFFEEYLQLLKVTLGNATPIAKQRIIEKMNHSSRIFFDNCTVDDANFAQQTKDYVIRLGHDFMKEFDRAQEKELSLLINKLEELVGSSKTNLVVIENLDTEINKAILKNYPSLYQKYQQITTKLTTSLMEKPSEEKIKSYNLRAVESFRKAQNYFINNESSIKKGQNLEEIIKYLGGWDLQYLSSPTQIYYQNVYSDIFSKLDANIKPQMTERILKATSKGII